MDDKGRTTAFRGGSGTELGEKGFFMPERVLHARRGILGLDDLQGPSSVLLLECHFPLNLSRLVIEEDS